MKSEKKIPNVSRPKDRGRYSPNDRSVLGDGRCPVLPQRLENWPLDKLIPYERNPRTHSDEHVRLIAASIAEFGFTAPILVDGRAGILAGHGRYLAARHLRLTEVPVVVLDHLSEIQRRAYIIADNQIALGAGWNEELLRLELTELASADFELDLLGFDDAEMGRVLTPVYDPDEDLVPDVPELPVSATGDLWLLGDHRLAVGDATDEAAVRKLMATETADLVFTDPPYNVGYEGHTGQHLTIQNDQMTGEEYKLFLARVFRSYRLIVKPTASLYVCHASAWQREFQDALESAGFTVRTQLIWAKNAFAFGFSRYKFSHEPIFYAYVTGNKDAWFGDKTQCTLWQEDKPAASRLHPTMKPVELIERALTNSSKFGNLIVDLFGGSGSTMIACERRGRRANLMELDPRYADVIVRRWQQWTHRTATLDNDGRSFEQIAGERARTCGTTQEVNK